MAERARRNIERERDRLARDAEGIRDRCKTLPGFIREAWHVLEPETPYIHGWHIDCISEHLEAITRRQITRLAINEPPGCMKSLVASVFWEAWEWGPADMAHLRYLTTSYTETYARRDSRKHRDLVMSEWYQTLWPHVVLTRDNEADFENTKLGSRKAMPFASLTSGRGNRVVIDDPHSVDGAESDTDRKAAVRRFRESVPSRLNDPKHDAIMVIMHRLHPEDVCGAIDKFKMDYVKVILPMEFIPTKRLQTRWYEDPRTQAGELLAPERQDAESLAKTKTELTSHAFAVQYQQEAKAREGGQFKRHWFKTVGAVPADVRIRVRRWDLAATTPAIGTDPDYTAGVKMAATRENRFYIEHVEHFRDTGLKVRTAIKNYASRDGRSCYIRIPQDPGQAGKDQAANIIAENAGYHIGAERETGSKETRAEPLAAQCEAGNVYLVDDGSWDVEGFIDEMCSVPQGHDDRYDAAAGAFNFCTQNKGPLVVSEEALARARQVPAPGSLMRPR